PWGLIHPYLKDRACAGGCSPSSPSTCPAASLLGGRGHREQRLLSAGKMTDLCEPCEGSSLGSEPQESTTSPGAPTTSKHASPSVSELILWAVATSPKCQGLSLEALKKIITKAGYDVVRNKTHFLRVLKGLISKGLLKQMTGMGATGSFRAGKKKKDMKKDQRAGKKRKMPRRRRAPKHVSSKASRPVRRGRKRQAAE
uniref:H15 domain-containing protein n=1 Tax=Gopherus agassizii TaxID=38772 RepID=A0A452HH13_9SAUR